MRVTCKIYLGRPYAFDVTLRKAYDNGNGALPFLVSGGPDSNHLAMDTATWSGPIISTSNIFANVEQISPTGVRKFLQVHEMITVDPRAAPPYSVRTPVEHDTVHIPDIAPYPLVSFLVNGLPTLPLVREFGIFMPG
jgi:hypothetical protein